MHAASCNSPTVIEPCSAPPVLMHFLCTVCASVTRQSHAFLAGMDGCFARADVVAIGACGCPPCRHEMEAVRPILIVAPATMLPFWEGETALWMGDDANVIVYAGSLSARNMMHDHELWLSPGSLDGKSATHKTREVHKFCPVLHHPQHPQLKLHRPGSCEEAIVQFAVQGW